MPQPFTGAIYCINPDCPRPYPHNWGNKFCNSCGSPLQLKNRYIPIERLGAGGFAKIYTVWDLVKQQQRVLKVLVEHSPKALELFEQEAAVLASLHHPGVPRVESDGYFLIKLQNLVQLPRAALANNSYERQLPCLVMEKINGQTLAEILEQHPQGCSEAWVLNWLTQAVDILKELHSRQIIHRDLKPSNLMLREETGQVVVIDFGGAKQIGSTLFRSQASSTRLFSSGYSPPEQLSGSSIGPTADFYALGRTMIQLLTGKDFLELEDPVNGKLRWRSVSVNSALADLLDELVQEDVRQRPVNATAIQVRLAKISRGSRGQISFFKPISLVVRSSLERSRLALSAFTNSLWQTTLFLVKVIIQVARACLDTAWEIVLGVIGACVGTATGFMLAYWSPVGVQIADTISQQLSRLVPHAEINIGPDILIFTAAGLGTALGLTAAGGFGQRRRPLIAGLMGLLGYGLGGLVWQAATLNTGEGITVFIAIAVALLTLGLGLPSYYLTHAAVVASGCIGVFAGLAALDFYPAQLWSLFSVSSVSWSELSAGIAFFSLLSVTLGFWLGVSYYLIVPMLRFLGWR